MRSGVARLPDRDPVIGDRAARRVEVQVFAAAVASGVTGSELPRVLDCAPSWTEARIFRKAEADVALIGVRVTVARIDGARLARARREAGLTQPELARQLGVSSATRISLWERGAEQPRPRFIPELAKILGVPPLELLVGDPARPTISALRLAAGMTRDEVWQRARIAKMTYQRIDRGVGVRPPDPSIVRALSRVLGRNESDTLAAVERARLHAT